MQKSMTAVLNHTFVMLSDTEIWMFKYQTSNRRDDLHHVGDHHCI